MVVGASNPARIRTVFLGGEIPEETFWLLTYAAFFPSTGSASIFSRKSFRLRL
jgi:hypothetical protein